MSIRPPGYPWKNDEDIIDVEHVLALYEALGEDPVGEHETVAERLDDVDARLEGKLDQDDPRLASIHFPEVWVFSSDTPLALRQQLANATNVFICTGTNDHLVINQAINLAAPLYTRNTHSGVSSSAQLAVVRLSGGRFNISGDSATGGIRLRSGVMLDGSGILTELRAVSCNASGVIRLNSVHEHHVRVSNLWINGNGSSGGSCHGIDFDMTGSTNNNPAGVSGYPSASPDCYNNITDVFISDFEGGANRKGIYLHSDSGQEHGRAWLIDRVRVRRVSGMGIHILDQSDGILSNTEVGTMAYGGETGDGIGIYLQASNTRLSNVKAFYCEKGIVFDGGQCSGSTIEVQDSATGIEFTVYGRSCSLAGVTVDNCRDDGIVIGGDGNSITSFQVTQAAQRYATMTNGVRILSGVYDTMLMGQVYYQGITNRFVDNSGQAGTHFVRIIGDSPIIALN